MWKICIARRLVVDIFLWYNTNFVPFPSGTLVARRMGNGSIKGKNNTNKQKQKQTNKNKQKQNKNNKKKKN